MTEDEKLLAEDRALRNSARAVFNARREKIKAALSDRPVGSRIADEAIDRTRVAAGHAVKVADENRLVVAGTLAAVVLWFLRKPLISSARRLVQREERGELAAAWQRLLDTIKARVKA